MARTKFRFKNQRRSAASVASDGNFLVDAVIGYRQERGEDQYLIHWKNFPRSKATWEPVSNLVGLEDELSAYRRSLNRKRGQPGFSAQMVSIWKIHDAENPGFVLSMAQMMLMVPVTSMKLPIRPRLRWP